MAHCSPWLMYVAYGVASFTNAAIFVMMGDALHATNTTAIKNVIYAILFKLHYKVECELCHAGLIFLIFSFFI